MYPSVQVPCIFDLTLFLVLLSPFLHAQQVCYWPDGTEATSHTPCNGSASNTPTDASSCCQDISTSYCQDNNLCTWSGAMYRGACTDKTWRSPNCPQQCTGAQRNTAMNIFPCPAAGVWECEREGQCSTNFTLSPFGIFLRDSQLPGNKKEGIGLADPSAAASASAAAASSSASSSTPTVEAKSNNSDTLAVGLGVGIPLGLSLVTCLALLFRQQMKLKWRRAVAPPLGGTHEKSQGYNNASYNGTYDAQELPDRQRAVPELRG